MHQPKPLDRANSESSARQLQTFRSGQAQFGIFADDIAAIVDWREPAPLPHAPIAVLGVISVQGRMLTVLDLATISGHEASLTDRGPRQLIALRGDEQLAIAIDEAGDVVDVREDELNGDREKASTFVLSVLRRGDKEVNILDLKQLFPAAIQGRERRRRRF